MRVIGLFTDDLADPSRLVLGREEASAGLILPVWQGAPKKALLATIYEIARRLDVQTGPQADYLTLDLPEGPAALVLWEIPKETVPFLDVFPDFQNPRLATLVRAPSGHLFVQGEGGFTVRTARIISLLVSTPGWLTPKGETRTTPKGLS